MSSVKYEFRYMPLIGKLSGESMLQQTETAINEIAEIVNENTAQADIINTLAQDANDNSVEALEKANEALETSSRVYIHESLAVNLDSYCESQLIYVVNISSTNLPIAKKGFLEVKTDDDKTECVQLFVSDDKDVYVRSGSITAETVGDITVYTADFEEWTSLSSPTILLQAGSGTSIPLSSDLNNYNTEGTFYCSTTNVGSIAHCPVSEGEFKLIVMKFATANYGLQMLYPSGQHLYVRKYSGGAWGNWEVIVPKITSGVTNGSIAVNDTDVAVTGWNTKADLDSPVFVGTPTAPTQSTNNNSTRLATTEFVNNELKANVPLSGANFITQLTSNDDLNNVTAIGTYKWSDTTKPANAPTNDNNSNFCKMIVMCAQGVNYFYQLVFSHNGHIFKRRGRLDGGVYIFDPWKEFAYAEDVLPLSGGTMTGNILFSGERYIKNVDDTKAVIIQGGTNSVDGANLFLFGANSTSTGSHKGGFNLRTGDGTSSVALNGETDGTLTWGGVSLTDGTFLTTRKVTVTVAASPTNPVGSVTAPAVSGYQFVTWYTTSTEGAITPSYVDTPQSQTTSVWIPTSFLSTIAGKKVNCFALYVRKW